MNAIQHLDAFLEAILPHKMVPNYPARDIEIKMSMEAMINLQRELKDYVLEYGLSIIGQPFKEMEEGITIQSPKGTIKITHNGI